MTKIKRPPNRILTQLEINFIWDNKDTLKKCEIAEALKVTPACITQRLSGKNGKVVVMNDYFNVEEFGRYYNF